MRRSWLPLWLPFVAVVAGCEDFFDGDVGVEDDAFEDLDAFGDDEVHDSPTVDPIDLEGPFVSDDAVVAGGEDLSIVERFGPSALGTDLDPAGRTFVSVLWIGEDALTSDGRYQIDGDALVSTDPIVPGTGDGETVLTWTDGVLHLRAVTTWDFVGDEVDGPVPAEVTGTFTPAPPRR